VPTPKEYPPGFTTTIKYCAKGCGAYPTHVTLTVPITETVYETINVGKLTSEADDVLYSTPQAAYPTGADYPEGNKPEQEQEYEHNPSSVPSSPSASTPTEDETPVVYATATQLVTLSVVAVPASEYYASKSAAGPENVYSSAGPNHNPVTPGNTPAYYHPAPNPTVSFGTGAPSASKTAYEAPYFTGAAVSVKVGGMLGGVVVAAVGLLL
jgi:hypothetical protein